MADHTILWVDLETRSDIDLLTKGLMRYAQSPTTHIICLSYAFDSLPVVTWFPEDSPEIPKDLRGYIENSDGLLYAHNATFERTIFEYVIANDFHINPPALNRWRCSMVRAKAHGLPASLKQLGECLRVETKKRSEGARLIRDYSQTTGGRATPWKKNDKSLMQDYCEADVVCMRQICSMLRELTNQEWHQYELNEEINEHGVPVDIELAKAAMKYSDAVQKEMNNRIYQLTDGEVPSASERKSKTMWLRRVLPKTLLDSITNKETGNLRLDKKVREELAERSDTPQVVKDFIGCIDSAGGATIAKYKRMVDTHLNGRVHHVLQWNGAGTTGRYSSKGVQLQNMRRDAIDDPSLLIDKIKAGKNIDKPSDTLGRLIRSAITCKGGVTYSDYSQIEARILPWLTKTPEGDAALEIFYSGRDLYEENARKMFCLQSGEKVTSDLRQAAKVAVLSCGFGGGKHAIISMSKNYGLSYSEEEAEEIKNQWREANPWAPKFWWSFNSAVMKAVLTPGKPQTVGRVSLQYDGIFWLWMMLPSGRLLAYGNPRVEMVQTPWGEEKKAVTAIWGAKKPKAGEKWPRRTINHIVLSENATQATAADIMRETVVRAEDSDIPVLFTVHDEIIVEGRHEEQLHKVMTEAPTWALGLPIDAVTTYSKRYGK